jgi:hypothetical protein
MTRSVTADENERALKVARNQSTFRDANERMRQRAVGTFRFEAGQRVRFVCECADPSCREVLMLRLDEYERVREHPSRFLLVAGHEDDSTHERIVEAEEGYAVVEKVGTAGAEAARLDPRGTRERQ